MCHWTTENIPFALTGQLLPLLRKGRQPRVVNLSSGAHRLGGAIHFEDLRCDGGCPPHREVPNSSPAFASVRRWRAHYEQEKPMKRRSA
jgi:NAD(P)-dependent dehydrogenase (short-subunit alcohol dehydrogenase family)